jgi:hypothetical protein
VKFTTPRMICAAIGITFTLNSSSAVSRPGVRSFQIADELWQELGRVVHAGDSYRIVEIMAMQGEPLQVATLYFSALGKLYRADDLRSVVVVGQKAIDYCLTQAVEAGKRQDPSLETELRGRAKEISYNLGSYTWPGWAEPGIQIGPADMAAGFEAARLNLRLGEQLKRGPEPMSRAHWLLGAHALAAGKHSDAVEHFQLSAQLAGVAGNRSEELLAQGYRALTLIAGKAARADGEAELKRVKDALRVGNPKEGQFWIDQLETASRVLIAK